MPESAAAADEIQLPPERAPNEAEVANAVYYRILCHIKAGWFLVEYNWYLARYIIVLATYYITTRIWDVHGHISFGKEGRAHVTYI